MQISAQPHPQTSHWHLHSVERQPECVQLVEGVGLVASGFQFFSRLAAVFAEEARIIILSDGLEMIFHL